MRIYPEKYILNCFPLAITHTHTHARTHARTHAHAHTHTRTHTHTHTHTHSGERDRQTDRDRDTQRETEAESETETERCSLPEYVSVRSLAYSCLGAQKRHMYVMLGNSKPCKRKAIHSAQL